MISLSNSAARGVPGRTVGFCGIKQSKKREASLFDLEAQQPLLPPPEESPRRGVSWGSLLKVAGILLLGVTGILSGAAVMARPVGGQPMLGGGSGGAGHFPLMPLNGTTPVLPPATALSLPGLRPIPIASPMALPYPEPALVSHWAPHVELLASSSQNHYSYFSNNGSDYTNSLMDIVRRNETHSLGQSHAVMWEQGYPIRSERQRPISSADVADSRCLSIWDKRDTHKQRFALLLDGGPEFRKDCQRWRSVLRKEFSVPKRNILYYPNSNSSHVERGLQKISKTIQTRGLDPADVEVMVYYSGHGQALHEGGIAPRHDGDAVGTIALSDGRYREEALRDELETSLPDIPTTVILDACQSGAWIA